MYFSLFLLNLQPTVPSVLVFFLSASNLASVSRDTYSTTTTTSWNSLSSSEKTHDGGHNKKLLVNNYFFPVFLVYNIHIGGQSTKSEGLAKTIDDLCHGLVDGSKLIFHFSSFRQFLNSMR